MFETETVYSCPIAKQSLGVVKIIPEIITILAGAVLDPDEWLVLLLGEKDENGLNILVDDLYVPRSQTRTSGTCNTEEDLPDEVTNRVVGVLHSHHKMGGFFSGTDRCAEGLNQRFPMSIVISSRNDSRIPEFEALGFAYEAEGRVTLPCGTLGVVRFKIVPDDETEWPFPHISWMPDHKTMRADNIGDCAAWYSDANTSRYHIRRIAECGTEESEPRTRFAAFGRDGDYITSKLPAPTRTYFKVHKGKGKGKGQVNPDRLLGPATENGAIIVYPVDTDYEDYIG